MALFGLQIATVLGAEVFVTSGSADKRARAGALGADPAIDRADWVEAVDRLTGDRGIDHILEIVGGPHLARSFGAVAVKKRISVIDGFDRAASAGPQPEAFSKRRSVVALD